MTDYERMLHPDDFSSPDSTELWMVNTPFASYPPTSYSSMYDAAVFGYQSDFDTSPQSISSSAGSPSSVDFDFHPSFADDHAGARGRHIYGVDASTTQLFSGDKFSSNESSFDALGLMGVGRLDPPFLMDQQPRTVHMSDVIVPNASSPSTVAPQSRSDALPSLSSSTVRASTRPRQLRRNHFIDDGESEVDSEGDSYCPSDASGTPTDYLPAGPASPLINPPPVRRRRRQDINLPVPVPNLTKKSRGRKVPTSSGEPLYALSKDKSKKGTRTYTCHVDGCAKCFVRSEHLKRHIRSIHTNDKRERDSSALPV